MRWRCPPDAVAFTAAEVAQVLEAGRLRTPSDAFFGRPVGVLAGPAALPVLRRLQAAAETLSDAPIGFVSFAAVLEYPAGAGGLPWHRDRLEDDRPGAEHHTEAQERVLSCTVQLSDAEDYTGGELEGDGGLIAPKAAGTVVFFPSTTRHRVTPVTAGCRLSLTAFWGPA